MAFATFVSCLVGLQLVRVRDVGYLVGTASWILHFTSTTAPCWHFSLITEGDVGCFSIATQWLLLLASLAGLLHAKLQFKSATLVGLLRGDHFIFSSSK